MNNDKITLPHKQRIAVVYVRQSTATQVLHSLESQKRQYALKEYASNLGFVETEVIDDDLGRSGSGLVERPGFARLLERICLGEVGAVLALEASRLARNNRDWHHLVDLCAIADTLVIDYDGIYDARLLNDRLLLGLKGTMSEFELGLLRQRAQAALRQKIARGEVLHVPPIGYERTEDNRLEMTPDLQMQQAIREVFHRFRETGSARQVLLAARQEGLRLPSRDQQGRVVWRLPVFGRIIKFLKNPTYAGVYGYGRTMKRTRIENGREMRTAGHRREQKDWLVLLRDHHPGYITWAEYEANQQMLLENCAMRGKMRTAVKRGAALLSGLLRCGHCGRALHVYYTGTRGSIPRYFCRGAMINHGSQACISVGAVRLDAVMQEQVLAVLQPAGIEASLQAEQLSAEKRQRRRETIALALERARYEADRSHRQYQAVEPENRLVAAELERRWNVALEEVARLNEELRNHDLLDVPVAAEDARRLRTLGGDVPAVWHHPSAPLELKKRIIRTVIQEIVVCIQPSPSTNLDRATSPHSCADAPWMRTPEPEVECGKDLMTLVVHWSGGVHTTTQFIKPTRHAHPHSTPADTVDLIRKLADICPDEQIAVVLNRNGRRTGKGLSWKAHNVADARRRHQIGAYAADRSKGWLNLEQTSAKLEMSPETARRLIRQGILPAQQIVAHAPWVIAPQSLKLPEVARAAAMLRKTGRCCLPDASVANLELPLE